MIVEREGLIERLRERRFIDERVEESDHTSEKDSFLQYVVAAAGHSGHELDAALPVIIIGFIFNRPEADGSASSLVRTEIPRAPAQTIRRPR